MFTFMGALPVCTSIDGCFACVYIDTALLVYTSVTGAQKGHKGLVL